MLNLFKSKHHSILGIDISSSSIKIIEISGTKDNRRIESYGRELLPSGAVDGNVIKNTDAVADCIKKIMKRSQPRSKVAVLALPDSAVISKTIQVDKDITANETEEFILMEADKYIPFPIDEINMDFLRVGKSTKNNTMDDVLIVASRTENVSSRVEALSKAGLQTAIVEVESYAVERALQTIAKELAAPGQDKIIAVIDIGTSFSHFFILQGLKVIFTREEEYGGRQLIELISQYYHLDYQQAFQMKESGKMPDDYEQQVLNPFIETLLIQIKRTLQFFFSTSHYSNVDHIYLAGGVANLPKLASLVEEKIKIATTVANPLKQLNLAAKVDVSRINRDASSLVIACGLALREME